MFLILNIALLTSRYGGKLFFGAGIGFCSFLTILTPLAAYAGPSGVIVLRILQGLAQVKEKKELNRCKNLNVAAFIYFSTLKGFIFPAMHCLWSKWAPPSESEYYFYMFVLFISEKFVFIEDKFLGRFVLKH